MYAIAVFNTATEQSGFYPVRYSDGEEAEKVADGLQIAANANQSGMLYTLVGPLASRSKGFGGNRRSER